MKKQFLLLSVALVFPFISQGAVVTPEQALERAQGEAGIGLLTRAFSEAVPDFKDASLEFTLRENSGEPTVYVFNQPGKGGTVFLSADDGTPAVLGYSDNGTLHEGEMPPALNYWLNEYSRQITALRESGNESAGILTYAASMAPVAPLVSTKWNQDVPYNNDCQLTFNNGAIMQCVTGCVATAMAQMMNYFQYPERGEGEITYNPYTNTKPLELDFSAQSFDWANMLDKYVTGDYNETEAAAVAYLMKACGYSVEMQYGDVESGADPRKILNAITTYFKYSDSSQYLERKNYTLSEWIEVLYNHLSAVGPIIYNGNSLNGGHSFICDGYQGGGYFHFNWGWGGLSDGYFLIDLLNPTAQGIGGYSGGYNLSQSVILPVKESTSTVRPQVSQFGSLRAEIKGNNIVLSLTEEENYKGWSYYGTGNYLFDFGLLAEEINGEGTPQFVATNFQGVELQANMIRYGEVSGNLSSLDLQKDKLYKLTLASSPSGSTDAEWTPVAVTNGLYNYVVIKKTDSGFEVIPNEARILEVDSLEALSPLYYGSSATFKTVITNPSDIELTRYLSAGFIDSDGYLRYISDYTAVTVNPGEKIEKEWLSNSWSNIKLTSPPTAVADYTMVLYDAVSQKIIVGDYFSTVQILPQTDLDYDITTQFPGMENQTVDALNGSAIVTVNVSNGYFNKVISLQVIEPIKVENPDGGYSYSYSSDNMVYSLTSNPVSLESGESTDVEFNFYFTGYKPETLYLVAVSIDGSWTGENNFVYFDSEGIAEYELYDMPSIVTPTPGTYDAIGTVYLSWEGVETLAFNEATDDEVTINGNPVSLDESSITGNVIGIPVSASEEGEYEIIVPEGLLIINNGYINREETLSFEVVIEAGIEGIEADTEGSYHIYRIDGSTVKISKDLNKIKELPSGLYIINGRKVMIAK